MKQEVKFSIITVTFNSEQTIERAILSVLKQKYQLIEYIIVDGLSTDNTLSIINRYKDEIAIILSESDTGIYDAINKGISLSTGDLVGILHSDDYLLDNTLTQIAQHYRPSIIISGNCQRTLTNGKVIVKKNRPVRYLKSEMALNHPATFIPREIYSEIGLYDTTYEIASDYKFIAECWKNKYVFQLIDIVVLEFSYGGLSDTKRIKSYIENYNIQKQLKINTLYFRLFVLIKKIILLPLKRLLIKIS